MTIEEAREYWNRRLECAEGYFDEHWDAEERHAHKDYIDAMTHAITALAICIEHEEVKRPKTKADLIRQMTDEELVKSIGLACKRCAYYYAGHGECSGQDKECTVGNLEWLKQEVQDGTD